MAHYKKHDFIHKTRSTWRIATTGEDQAMAIDNMHKKLGKDRAWGSRDILADRQTDRQADTHMDVVFATTLAGEVNMQLRPNNYHCNQTYI